MNDHPRQPNPSSRETQAVYPTRQKHKAQNPDTPTKLMVQGLGHTCFQILSKTGVIKLNNQSRIYTFPVALFIEAPA